MANPGVFNGINTTLRLVDFCVQLRDVGLELRVFVRLIQRVQSDVDEAFRLMRKPEVKEHFEADPGKKARVEETIHSVKIALNNIGKFIEGLRVDEERNGAVSLRNRFEWVLRHQAKLGSRQLELDTCHKSLLQAITAMQMMEFSPLALQSGWPTMPADMEEDHDELIPPRVRLRKRKDASFNWVARPHNLRGWSDQTSTNANAAQHHGFSMSMDTLVGSAAGNVRFDNALLERRKQKFLLELEHPNLPELDSTEVFSNPEQDPAEMSASPLHSAFLKPPLSTRELRSNSTISLPTSLEHGDSASSVGQWLQVASSESLVSQLSDYMSDVDIVDTSVSVSADSKPTDILSGSASSISFSSESPLYLSLNQALNSTRAPRQEEQSPKKHRSSTRFDIVNSTPSSSQKQTISRRPVRTLPEQVVIASLDDVQAKKERHLTRDMDSSNPSKNRIELFTPPMHEEPQKLRKISSQVEEIRRRKARQDLIFGT